MIPYFIFQLLIVASLILTSISFAGLAFLLVLDLKNRELW